MDPACCDPLEREPSDAGLLGRGDRFDRMTEAVRRPGLDLAEHELAPAADDEVEFAVAAPPIPVEDLVAPAAVPVGSETLAAPSERLVVVTAGAVGWIRHGPTVRTTPDSLDRAVRSEPRQSRQVMTARPVMVKECTPAPGISILTG